MPRAGNIYGLDIKLTPNGKGIKPVCIEINGVDFGTNFFGYDEGFAYYEKFVRTVASQTKRKPIFIEGAAKEGLDYTGKIIVKNRLEEKYKKSKRVAEELLRFLGEHFEFDDNWVDDFHKFKLENLEEVFDDSEDRFYSYAAKKQGVRLFIYDDISFGKNNIQFYLPNRTKISLNPNEVGIIRSKSSTLSDVPSEYKPLFLNSSLIEGILDSKPFVHFLGAYINESLQDLFAPGIIYGCGVNETRTLIETLEGFKSDLVVRKKGDSYCGAGVEILERNGLIKKLKTGTLAPISQAKKQAMVMFILGHITEKFNFENLVNMYEQFVPSIRIYDPRTKNVHDGCARTVVYSPPDNKPIILGSQWRLAPAPIEEQESTLEDRFRANLSRGAREMKIDTHHQITIDNFAIKVVEEFEKAIRIFKYQTQDNLKSLKRINPDLTYLDILRFSFWYTYLRPKFLELDDVSRGEKSISDFPGVEEELKGMRRLISSPLIQN